MKKTEISTHIRGNINTYVTVHELPIAVQNNERERENETVVYKQSLVQCIKKDIQPDLCIMGTNTGINPNLK